MAYCSKYVDKLDNKYFVVMGDGEIAEGQIWEACNFAAFNKLDNVIGFVDVNRMGQTTVNMYDHDVEHYRKKFEAFGWHSVVIDGHDIAEVILATQWARANKDSPSVIIAKTFKGKNLSENIENKDWHGKPLGNHNQSAISYLKGLIKNPNVQLTPAKPEKQGQRPVVAEPFKINNPQYPKGQIFCRCL